jgi:hypothetical protein
VEEESRQPGRDPHRKKVVRGLWIGLAVIGAALIIMALWLYVGPSTPTQKKDFVQAVGVLIAGLAGFVGLYFTWTNLDLTRRTTQRTLELTEQGQITERFTRAIDQLGATDDDGNPRLEVRLGGIYALERIDKESPERVYHGTVMEVLTAYVRENAPWRPNTPKPSAEPPTRSFLGRLVRYTLTIRNGQDKGAKQDAEPPPQPPRTDIQAILDILKRREEDNVPKEHRVRLDLRGTDLRSADLTRIHLKNAYLQGAHLEEANLYEAHLEGAILWDAHLEGAYLPGAHLQKADFRGARLQKAFLPKAHLEEANLWDVHLEEAFLQEANLEKAILYEARLEGASGLTPQQIGWTLGDEDTVLPDYLVDDRPRAWSKSHREQRIIIEERLKQEPKD